MSYAYQIVCNLQHPRNCYDKYLKTFFVTSNEHVKTFIFCRPVFVTKVTVSRSLTFCTSTTTATKPRLHEAHIYEVHTRKHEPAYKCFNSKTAQQTYKQQKLQSCIHTYAHTYTYTHTFVLLHTRTRSNVVRARVVDSPHKQIYARAHELTETTQVSLQTVNYR